MLNGGQTFLPANRVKQESYKTKAGKLERLTAKTSTASPGYQKALCCVVPLPNGENEAAQSKPETLSYARCFITFTIKPQAYRKEEPCDS
jgi:hypothetical protein